MGNGYTCKGGRSARNVFPSLSIRSKFYLFRVDLFAIGSQDRGKPRIKRKISPSEKWWKIYQVDPFPFNLVKSALKLKITHMQPCDNWENRHFCVCFLNYHLAACGLFNISITCFLFQFWDYPNNGETVSQRNNAHMCRWLSVCLYRTGCLL